MRFREDLFIIGAAVLVVFILLIAFIVFFLIVFQRSRQLNAKEKKQLHSNFEQELLKTQLETQEDTFNKIGGEIHDNIGQLLSSTRILLSVTERSIPFVPDTLKTADQTLALAISDLRLLSKSLSKEWLSQFNLIDNLQSEVDRINSAQICSIELQYTVKFLPLDADHRIMLFRVIQEAMHNAMKHANAKSIKITIVETQLLVITIEDNGKGFDPEKLFQNGIGLINMRRRTELLGGTISWESTLERGTTVIINIPIKPYNYED